MTIANLLLVDDHPVVLGGYQTLLRDETDLKVIGQSTTVNEAFNLLERYTPDLVISDLTMPGRSGLDFIKDLLAINASQKILVISMHDETVWAERVLKAGAKGYLMKDNPSDVMLGAIRTVLKGGIYLSPTMTARILQNLTQARSRSTQSPLQQLSDREFEVYRLFGEGLTAKEIAFQLQLSPKTIAVHRDHIKEKMGFQTSAEMIREAVRWVESQI